MFSTISLTFNKKLKWYEKCSLRKTCILTSLSSLSFWSGLFHLWIWLEPSFQIGVSVQIENKIANSDILMRRLTRIYTVCKKKKKKKKKVLSAGLKGLIPGKTIRCLLLIRYSVSQITVLPTSLGKSLFCSAFYFYRNHLSFLFLCFVLKYVP